MRIMADESILKKLIKPGERLDDLQRNGFVIIQDPALFCFGMDAVLLSDFARAGRGEQVLDMCTGNGVIPLLMAAKGKGGGYTGIELQEKSADLARRNAIINNMSESFRVLQGDICRSEEIFKEKRLKLPDVITCNPPYMAGGDGLVNPEDAKALARHEISCTFTDVAYQASRLLKSGGHIYLVHRPRRLAAILKELMAHSLEPKRLRFVHSFEKKAATMVLIDAVKGGNTQLIVEPPLIIYGDDGEYTPELKEMY